MSVNVFANNREIVCKSASGKSICAFPDVCLSPPSPPAGPVPIPYPNTAFASDTTNGSTSVRIAGKEVMLRDKSVFKKSTGDEAATRSFGANVITHALTGKASFVMWSMDVKIEGANVDRHLDLTVHNHQSKPPGTPPMAHASTMAVSTGTITLECDPTWTDCQKEQMKQKAAKMDAIAKAQGPLRTRATKGRLREAGDSWAAKFARDWEKDDPNKRTRWPAQSDPSQQDSHFYADCAKTTDPLAAGMQADHVHEVQLGGNPSGPFLWLDGAVNGASGRQIKSARSRGITSATGFNTKNC